MEVICQNYYDFVVHFIHIRSKIPVSKRRPWIICKLLLFNRAMQWRGISRSDPRADL